MTTWHLPAKGRVTSGFGPRNLPGAVSSFHYGTDIGARGGPVYACADGTVRSIWQTVKGAWVLDLDHGAPYRTRYIHMERDDILPDLGDRVTGGQRVGTSGSSGTAANHLHLEVLISGAPVDPVPFLADRGVHLGVTLVDDDTDTPTPPTVPDLDPPEDLTMALSDQDVARIADAVWQRMYLGQRMQARLTAAANRGVDAMRAADEARATALEAKNVAQGARNNGALAVSLIRTLADKLGHPFPTTPED